MSSLLYLLCWRLGAHVVVPPASERCSGGVANWWSGRLCASSTASEGQQHDGGEVAGQLCSLRTHRDPCKVWRRMKRNIRAIVQQEPSQLDEVRAYDAEADGRPRLFTARPSSCARSW